MTETEKQELRVKVAELCGWRDLQPYKLCPTSYVGRKPESFEIEGRTFLPDYPNDLNACAEFEKGLVESIDQARYTEALCDGLSDRMDNFPACLRRCCFATATQRCQAFVKVMEEKQ